MDFKRIPILIDAATGKQIDENGKVISRDSEYMRLVYSETCVICATFYDITYEEGAKTLTPHPLPENAKFQCMGDNDFDEATTLMFLSEQTTDENNKIDIAGDWIGGTTADRSLGQVSFRINTRTSKFIEVLTTGKYENANVYCAISMIPEGQTESSALASFKYKAINRITSAGGAPETADPEYYNATEINALIAAGITFQFSPDGQNDWSDTQRPTDFYMRASFNGGSNYGIAVELPTGPGGATGDGLHFDGYGIEAELNTHDAEPAGYIYLATDVAEFYIKNSDTSGDWSDPVILTGKAGKDGNDGKNNYELWLEEGNTGTIADYFNTLKGDPGNSAPSVLIQYSSDNENFHGIPLENDKYIRISRDGGTNYDTAMLVKGNTGKSAFDSWQAQGYAGTEEDFINWLKGDKGDQGDGLNIDAICYSHEIDDLFPNPETGFKVLTKDTICIYQWEGTKWSAPVSIKGDDGTAWTIGSELPETARIGDFHLTNISPFTIHYLSSQGWSEIGTLLGDPGEPGKDGTSAPQVQCQYSADACNWHPHSDISDQFMRFSYDNGISWEPAFRFNYQSLYHLWLASGNTGTEEDFMDWIKSNDTSGLTTFLLEHDNNLDKHITPAEREAWNAKADIDDIPTDISDITDNNNLIPTDIDDLADESEKLPTTDEKAAMAAANSPASGNAFATMDDLNNLSDPNYKGWYTDDSALDIAFPTGQNGWFASIGSTDTIWIWDADTNAWCDTDTKGQVASVNGKQGTVILTKADIGLDQANNTSDADKPVSTAQQTALDSKSNVGHTHGDIYAKAGRLCTLLSPDASSTGIDNISGGYAAFIESYDSETRTIIIRSIDTYDLKEEPYSVGNDIYIVINMSDDNGLQKMTIESLSVTYQADGVTPDKINIVLTGALAGDYVIDETTNAVAIVADTEEEIPTDATGIGNIVVGESSTTDGAYNLTVGIGSDNKGAMNHLIGDNCHVSGISNLITGESITCSGISNKINGSLIQHQGSNAEIDGQGIYGFGDMLNITGIDGMAIGRGITMSDCNLSAAIGNQLNVTAKTSLTIGYKLTNDADKSILLGQYGELDNSPENEGSFVIAGGETTNPAEAFSVRSRKKIINPLYNSSLDPLGTGTDSEGEPQYIGDPAFTNQYKGRLIGTTQELTFALGSIELDHDQYNRWKITPSGNVALDLTNWIDGDIGYLVIYNGNGYIAFPAEWQWIGDIPTLTSRNAFKIEIVDDTIYIRDITKSGISDYNDLRNKPDIPSDLSNLTDSTGILADKASITHSHDIKDLADSLNIIASRISITEKGVANGVADLDENGLIRAAQLPGFVDDVVDYANFAALPATGESGKIYVTTDNNKQYRWSGATYAEISSSLALGTISTTAFRGDHGQIAYNHSQITGSNPHNLTKTTLGLGNVDNTSDENKPVSSATQTALNSKANGNHTHDFSLLYAGINHGHTISSITDLQNFYCNSGNIGINIHNPQEKLHIVGNARIDNTDNDTYFRINSYFNSGNYNDASILFSTPRSTSEEGANVTGRGIITAKGNGVDAASDLYIAAATASLAPETVSSAQMYIKVHAGGTAGGAVNHLSIGSGSDIFYVSGDGKVGINITAPSEELDVAGNIAVGRNNFISSNIYHDGNWKYKSDGYGGYLKLAESSGNILLQGFDNNISGADAIGTPFNVFKYSIASNSFSLYTSGTERMSINSSGNVGIGTTSPSEKLEVNGNLKVTGEILGEVSGLQAALDAKADNNHNHDFSLVFANITHSHAISEITDLEDTLTESRTTRIDSSTTTLSGTASLNCANLDMIPATLDSSVVITQSSFSNLAVGTGIILAVVNSGGKITFTSSAGGEYTILENSDTGTYWLSFFRDNTGYRYTGKGKVY